MFTKGNTYGKGRPKKRSTIIKEFIMKYPNAYDEMMEILYSLARDKSDKDAAQYICDRLKGRPHQSIDQRLHAKVEITTLELDQALLEAREYSTRVLGENV